MGQRALEIIIYYFLKIGYILNRENRKRVIMHDITIYTSNTCVFCKAAKQYFKENNIEYTEKNIDQDKEAVNYLIEKGYRGVPVINIDGEDIVGFDKKVIEEKLK